MDLSDAKVDNIELNQSSEFVEVVEKKCSISILLKRYTYLSVKKIFDIICALIGCIMLVPLYIGIKLAHILSDDFSGIIYSQKRIGQDGKEFDLYKFRSMIVDADEELERILEADEELAREYKINKKLENDPRITKIGNFLRRTSLDEMPQFLNVLKGDMSVIGNRPYLPKEKEDMGDYFDNIVKTKCGIISYWAIMGRSDVSFKRRLELESYYSDNQSFILDMKIFFNVFAVVLLKKGAK